MRKPRDGRTEAQTEGESDFIGHCPTNVECPIFENKLQRNVLVQIYMQKPIIFKHLFHLCVRRHILQNMFLILFVCVEINKLYDIYCMTLLVKCTIYFSSYS